VYVCVFVCVRVCVYICVHTLVLCSIVKLYTWPYMCVCTCAIYTDIYMNKCVDDN